MVRDARTYSTPDVSHLRRERNRDGRTAQQKNMIENTTKKTCRFSQPNALSTARKTISTGIVIKSRVTITSFRLGSEARRAEFALCAAAWRDVDKRETKIEPAAPGKPKNHPSINNIHDTRTMWHSYIPLITTAKDRKSVV